MKNEIKNLLMRALETELKSEDVRTYLVNTLVDNLLKLEDGEEKAPQVQAEELLDDLEIGPILLSLANKNYSDEMKQLLAEWSSLALSIAKSHQL